MPNPSHRRPWHRPDSFLLAWLLALGQAMLAGFAITREWVDVLTKHHHGYSHYATDRGATFIFTVLAATLLASAVFLLWRHRATATTVAIGQVSVAGIAALYIAGLAGIPVTTAGWLVVTGTILLPVAIAVSLGRYIYISPPGPETRR